MRLETIEAVNFRNLSGKIRCGRGLNILYGDNGQGKTNWLEAIGLLATTRSFRTKRLQEATKFGENLAIVRGHVVHQGIERDLQIHIQGSSKSNLVNGKKESISRYLSQLHAVTFTSADLEIVRGGPEGRREFIDHGALSLHVSYARTLADYQRIIKQKNALLRQGAEGSISLDRMAQLIGPWNDQQAEVGAQVHEFRTEYVLRLADILDKSFFGNETIEIRYVSSLEGKGDLSDYRALLRERLVLDCRLSLRPAIVW